MAETNKVMSGKVYRVVCLGAPAQTEAGRPAVPREARPRVIRVCADADVASAPAVVRA